MRTLRLRAFVTYILKYLNGFEIIEVGINSMYKTSSNDEIHRFRNVCPFVSIHNSLRENWNMYVLDYVYEWFCFIKWLALWMKTYVHVDNRSTYICTSLVQGNLGLVNVKVYAISTFIYWGYLFGYCENIGKNIFLYINVYASVTLNFKVFSRAVWKFSFSYVYSKITLRFMWIISVLIQPCIIGKIEIEVLHKIYGTPRVGNEEYLSQWNLYEIYQDNDIAHLLKKQ